MNKTVNSNPASFNPNSSILWRQVWSLAFLLAAVMVSWMIYGYYQPKILESLGFAALAAQLSLIQGLLGAIVEPLIGWKSDQLFRRLNSRFPLITIGVTLAGLIFVVTAVLLQSQIRSEVRWLMPFLMTVWVIAMIIFRGPAIALLRQYAPSEQLPKANAILTFVFGLTGAIAPLIEILIAHLGAALTFLFGAVFLMISALTFRRANPQLSSSSLDFEKSLSTNHALFIFTVGVAAGIQTTLLLKICPQILHLNFPLIGEPYFASIILLIAAFSPLWLERAALAWGIYRSMFLSLFSISVLFVGLFFNDPTIALFTIPFGFAFGLLFISQIPYALKSAPVHQAGFGTGLYFGGIGGGSAIVSFLVAPSPSTICAWGILASAIGGIGLMRTRR